LFPVFNGGRPNCPGGRDRGTALYRPSFHLPSEDRTAVEDVNRRRFAELRDGEIALGSTLIGPHRDEIEFRLDDDLAKVRASQGQARTLALAWKWEERLYLKEKVGRGNPFVCWTMCFPSWTPPDGPN
jgi:DNA replication and repair protein RecF